MIKITQQAQAAFNACERKKLGNTTIEVDTCPTEGCKRVTLYLHGNAIAQKVGGKVRATLAGWPTPTTRERLKAAGVQTYQQAGEQYMRVEGTFQRVDPAKWYTVR